tara:strand:- start:3353 stop:3535 length:183 start_codon:yes stop_codon:yes gene_type:complete
MTDFYTFTVEIENKKKRKQPPTVCIRFYGCKNMDDANKLAEHLNIMLNTDMLALEGESLH